MDLIVQVGITIGGQATVIFLVDVAGVLRLVLIDLLRVLFFPSLGI